VTERLNVAATPVPDGHRPAHACAPAGCGRPLVHASWCDGGDDWEDEEPDDEDEDEDEEDDEDEEGGWGDEPPDGPGWSVGWGSV
jgi:hypothetical protein